jgi:tRNA A37 threonylcarbamoyladenosine dehydratase
MTALPENGMAGCLDDSTRDAPTARSRAVLGDGAFGRLVDLHVAVFGVGGVGGWCAEALVRTGVRHLTLVDDDAVAATNINRQRQATLRDIGKPKVEVLKDILLEIAPDTEIEIICERYTPESAGRFGRVFSGCDVIVDAIDSVDCKADLMLRSGVRGGGLPVVFSSMGAALRMDPTKVRVAPFHKVIGDGLAKALRGRFRKSQIPLPRNLCVYSEEIPEKSAASVKGSLMPVTCAFGMALASLVLRYVQPDCPGAAPV